MGCSGCGLVLVRAIAGRNPSMCVGVGLGLMGVDEVRELATGKVNTQDEACVKEHKERPCAQDSVCDAEARLRTSDQACVCMCVCVCVCVCVFAACVLGTAGKRITCFVLVSGNSTVDWCTAVRHWQQ